MKKLVLSTLTLAVIGIWQNTLLAQTVVYSEDFDGAQTWTLNTDQTAEDSNPNVWYISCQEEGVGSGNCGAACGAGNKTLHIGADPLFGDNGALYIETGLAITGTNRRSESADISTVGFTNLTLNFDMIGFGGNAQDYAEVFYSTNSGGTWTSIATPLTAACCGGPCTGLEQGLWQTNTYVLPASCENIATLRISFVWKNLDDGVATDPSIAVDNIEITTPTVSGPTASFTTPITTICVGTCIDFTNTSTGGPFTATDWTFTGATPATSAANNPTNICYNTPGTYQVQLTVNDGTNTDTDVQAAYITVVANPNAGADGSSNLCNNTTLNLNTLLSGADPGGTWAETSGSPSGQFTVGTGVLDGNGLTVGNVYTFTYTVNATAPCAGSDVSTFTITIVDCSAGLPTASFTPSSTTICTGDCITFVENSFGSVITGWNWNFSGGTPSTSAVQNPGSICYNTAGVYNIVLTVSDGTNIDDTTIAITVNGPTVTASASPGTTVCAGDPVTLTGGGAVTYVWDNGVTDGVAFTPATTTTYTVTGTDGGGCDNTATITITVNVCEVMIAGFTYQDNICAGTCITLTDTTTGVPISWNWDFGGGASPNTSTDQNPTVCFDTPGSYNIQLTTTDAGANNSSTTNTITVFGSPTVVAELDTVIDIGGQVELLANGSGLGSYLWMPDDNTIDCDTCASTYAEPWVATNYYVTFTDVNGCYAVDTVFVLVNFIEGIGVPQAFSPNGDDNNDILFVKGYGITAMDFSVYNRYGQKVFETTEQSIGWDGTFHGKDENPGVFAWVLEYTFINGNSGVLKGNTTLIR